MAVPETLTQLALFKSSQARRELTQSLTHAGEEAAAQSNHLLLPATRTCPRKFSQNSLHACSLDQSADVAL